MTKLKSILARILGRRVIFGIRLIPEPKEHPHAKYFRAFLYRDMPKVKRNFYSDLFKPKTWTEDDFK